MCAYKNKRQIQTKTKIQLILRENGVGAITIFSYVEKKTKSIAHSSNAQNLTGDLRTTKLDNK